MKKAMMVLFCTLFLGCAFDIAKIKYDHTQFAPVSESPRHIILKDSLEIREGPCQYYSRTLRQGTIWDYAGTIPQGQVYKPRDHVFTIECSQVYEAYLVLINDLMIGFYLPVEGGFAGLPSPKKVSFEEEKGG
jgi:hypothetical protein